MSLFSKDESYLGVDIGAGGIKMVELKKTKGRPQLWTYGIVDEALDIHLANAHEKTAEELARSANDTAAPATPQPAQPMVDLSDPRIERYAKLLKELLKASHATSHAVTASLPVSYIFHAVVTLPKVEEKELDHHVTAKVKKILPRPIEEMQVVHQRIPGLLPKEQQKDIKMLVTAAPKDLVAFYTAIFQRAGLKLQELETEAFALERSLVGRDTATVMVVDIGAERTNFFIIDQGLPITHRSIQVGGNDMDAILEKQLGMKHELVRQIKLDLSALMDGTIPTDLFASVLDPVVKEIQYSFDLFLAQSGNEAKRPEKIILTGGASLFPPITRYLSQSTGLKVFVGDPWARTVYQDGLKTMLDAIGPRMSVAIGLALRNIVS
jgi:type IV pilus assembly protein PilM